jgi:NAD(P)-dependent dehydrogenase (short-subunit alcohol dehydrogenase family)
VDISSLASIKSFAQRFSDSGRPLHVLVNNAGVMVLDRRVPSAAAGDEASACNQCIMVMLLPHGHAAILRPYGWVLLLMLPPHVAMYHAHAAAIALGDCWSTTWAS